MSDVDLEAKRFLLNVRKSRLVDESQLIAALRKWRIPNNHSLDAAISALSGLLVERRLLTAWQAIQLRKGKFKGFFLDSFVLLEHLADAVYVARDTVNNRNVKLRLIWPPEQPWWLLFSRRTSLTYEIL